MAMTQHVTAPSGAQEEPHGSDRHKKLVGIVICIVLPVGFFGVLLLFPAVVSLVTGSQVATLTTARLVVLGSALEGVFVSIAGYLLVQNPTLVWPLAAMARRPRASGVALLYSGLVMLANALIQYVLYPVSPPDPYLLGAMLGGGALMMGLAHVFRVQF